jgi:predicted nucleotidyltransferase
VKRAEVLRLLAEHRDELAAMGVEFLALFGSVARDEAGPDSDVDLLVEFEPSATVGIFRFLDIQEYLERVLGRPVDLVSREALKRQFRDQVLSEAVNAT